MTVPSALTAYLVSLPLAYGNLSLSHKVSSNPLCAVYENIFSCWREDHVVIRKTTSDSQPQDTRKKLNPKYKFFT